MDNFIIGSGIIFLVPFFTTIGVAPLKNDPILSGRSIRSFRHLEHKNLSIISDFIYGTRMVQEYWNGGGGGAAAGGAAAGVQFY